MKEEVDINLLTHLGEKWLESKIQRMKNLLKITEPDEVLYREIMLSLGYPKNKIQFLELALMLPFGEIKKLKEREKIEKALLYRAGFIDSKEGLPDYFDFSLRMNKSVWDFKRIRPANYPDKRIIGISYLLAKTISDGLINFFAQNILKEKKKIKNQKEAKKCVEKIMNFKGIGIQRKREMFFNIILPFCIAYYENQNSNIVQFLKEIFEIHPPLPENSIIKTFKSMINISNYSKLVSSTKIYFGAQFYIKNIQNKIE